MNSFIRFKKRTLVHIHDDMSSGMERKKLFPVCIVLYRIEIKSEKNKMWIS